MAYLISWRYSLRHRCYIIKRTDGRKSMIEKLSRVLRLDDAILFEAYKQTEAMDNLCEQSMALMKALRKKFVPPLVDEEEEMKTKVVWWTFLETGHVKILWLNGHSRWFPAADLLRSTDLKLLQQINVMPPNRSKPSAFLSQFEMDLGLRIDELVAAQQEAEVNEQGEDEGFYYSDDMTEEDYWG